MTNKTIDEPDFTPYVWRNQEYKYPLINVDDKTDAAIHYEYPTIDVILSSILVNDSSKDTIKKST